MTRHKAIELAEQYKRKGEYMFLSNQLTEAIKYYTLLIDMNPDLNPELDPDQNYAMCYNFRAICQDRLKNFDLALKDSLEAIEVNPKVTPQAYERIVNYYLLLRDPVKAKNFINISMKIYPNLTGMMDEQEERVERLEKKAVESYEDRGFTDGFQLEPTIEQEIDSILQLPILDILDVDNLFENLPARKSSEPTTAAMETSNSKAETIAESSSGTGNNTETDTKKVLTGTSRRSILKARNSQETKVVVTRPNLKKRGLKTKNRNSENHRITKSGRTTKEQKK